MTGSTRLSGVSRRRRFTDRAMTLVCGAAVALALIPVVSVLALAIGRGARALSIGFFTHLPAPVGESGGMANAIVGSLFLVGLAALVGIPFGIGAGLYLAERGDGRVGQALRFVTEVLAGVPSIVIGVVAYGLFVLPMGRFSALAGAAALAMIMIPTLARATEEVVRLVPRALREASLALGVPAWRTSVWVVLRTALASLVQVCLLVIARAAGETAPLLFTSLNNQHWNFRVDQPTASLTVQIFNYAFSPYEEWHDQAWAGALVLICFVSALSLLARGTLGRRAGA